jgi:hypothetical protein
MARGTLQKAATRSRRVAKRSTESKTGLISWDELVARNLTPEQIADAEAQASRNIEKMNLRAIREMVGVTQVEAAKRSKKTQGELSRIENNNNHRIETLRKYIEALGGDIEVIARFGNKTVRLTGI